MVGPRGASIAEERASPRRDRRQWWRAFSLPASLQGVLFRPVGDGRLAPLDGLRGLACLWMLLSHVCWYAWVGSPGWLYAELLRAPWLLPIWRGDFSIDIFFVLSGFLIGGLLLDEHALHGSVDVRRFYARRALRLWPTLVVAVLLERACLGGHAEHELWPNLLYVSNLLPILSVRMGWTWSLGIEEQFYVTVPWLMWGLAALASRSSALRRRDPMLLGLLGLLGITLCLVTTLVVVEEMHLPDAEIALDRPLRVWARGYDVLYSKPWMRAGPIFVGLVCARLYRTPGFMARLSQAGVAGTLGLVLAFAVGGAIILLPADAELPRPLEVAYLASYRTVFGIAVAYGMLLVLTEHAVGRSLGRVLAAPLFFPLGQVSYTTYLLNPIVATLSHGAFGPLLPSVGATVAILALIDVPLSFAAGFSLSVLIERPFMELRRFVAASPLASPLPAQPAA